MKYNLEEVREALDSVDTLTAKRLIEELYQDTIGLDRFKLNGLTKALGYASPEALKDAVSELGSLYHAFLVARDYIEGQG